MLFNSYDFVLLFLPVTLCAFYAVNALTPNYNGAVLVVASILFYGYWDPIFVPLLIASIAMNFLLGRIIDRRHVLALGVTVNLVVLGYFKYLVFLSGMIGWDDIARDLPGTLILPLGISFFTFQQISFLVDLRAGRIGRPSVTTYAAYVAFFPQLIAGPIVRYENVESQLKRVLRGVPKKRALILLSSGFAIFFLGLFKKVVIADALAQWADPVFAMSLTRPISGMEAWLGASAYTFQLYFDFSAYSDMALGLGRMFGVIFPANFYSPYKSKSIAQFWRRWHMSLSYFVRDYVFIPLGGSRVGSVARTRNLMIAFVATGVWHGAGYTFLIWGFYHGFLVAGAHLIGKFARRGLGILGQPVTFILVLLGWVIFRSENLSGAMSMYSSMFGLHTGRTVFHTYLETELGVLLIGVAAFIAFFLPNTLQLVGSRGHMLVLGLKQKNVAFTQRRVFKRILLPVLTGIAAYFSVTSISGIDSSFLYFNF